MKAYVDRDLCNGCGICEAVSPEVFKMDSENKAKVLVDEIPEGSEANAKDAEEQCAPDAIRIE